MKKLFLLILVTGAGVGAYLFWKRRSGPAAKAPAKSANPTSLQANKSAPAIKTTDDWMLGKNIWAIWSAVPTVDKGTAPGRWFDPEDTRQIYEENEAGRNVGSNSDNEAEYEANLGYQVDKDGYIIL
jgi:hypothetical protein